MANSVATTEAVAARDTRSTHRVPDPFPLTMAGMMAMLSAELRRRGFTGPRLRIAAHARAYVYSRAG